MFLLRERILLIILCMGLSIGGALYYLAKTPKTFTAVGALEVLTETQRVMGDVKAFNPEASSSIEAVKTVENALMSDSLMLRVVQVNELQLTHPRFMSDPKTGRALTEGELAKGMAGKVDAKQKRGSRTIEVFVDDRDPKMAAKLAASIMECYIASRDELQVGTQGEAVKDLIAKQTDLEKELQESEQELQAFREKNNTTDLDKNENQLKTRIFTVIGQVNKPDRIEFPPDGRMELMSAIASAGGFSKIADPGKVTIKRAKGGKETYDTRKLTNAVPIYPGDMVQVGESRF